MRNNENKNSRRKFIGTTALALTGLALDKTTFGFPAIVNNLGKPDSKFNGVQIGTITYSFRSMPSNAEQILQYCLDTNISAIELMGNTGEAFAGAPNTVTEPRTGGQGPGPGAQRTPEEQQAQAARMKEITDWRATVSMDKFEQLRKMYKQKGVQIYAWKPNALNERSTDAEIDYAFRSAKALGASHVTVELPTNAAHSKRLGEFAARHKIAVAYHGHLQQTITAWDQAIAQSAYNGLNCDIGHYVAAGFDPLPLIEQKHSKIYSIHLKDRKSKANGGENVVWGSGDTPIIPVLELMRKRKYNFPGTIELEYNIPEGSDAVKEVAKCVEFCRKALKG